MTTIDTHWSGPVVVEEVELQEEGTPAVQLTLFGGKFILAGDDAKRIGFALLDAARAPAATARRAAAKERAKERDLRYSLAYRDPVGEKAVGNITKQGRGGRT